MSTAIESSYPTKVGARAADGVARSHLTMILIVILACVAGYGYWTPIPENGLGWDGTMFARWVQQPSDLAPRQLSSYDAYRVLPSLAVSLGLLASGVEPTVPAVVLGFSVFDALLLVAAAALWWPIANALDLSHRARWLGFVGLFVNYAAMRMPFWMPVLTDYSGFLAGVLLLWLFVTRRSNLLLLAGCVAAFAWPAVGLSTALLLLVPRRDDSRLLATGRPSALATGIAAAVAAGLAGLWAWLYFARGVSIVGAGPVIPTVRVLLVASVPLAAAYTFLGLRTLLGGVTLHVILETLRTLRPWNVVRAAAAVVVPALIARATLIDPTAPGRLSVGEFLTFLAVAPITRPLITPVAHAVYYGPVILLAILCWRSVARASYGLGVGFVAFLCLQFMIALSSESRQAILVLPSIVAMVCVATERERWAPWLAWAIGIIALVTSKFWRELAMPGDPVSRHFTSHGPYMQNGEYAFHFVVAAAILAFLWLSRRGATAPAGERGG